MDTLGGFKVGDRVRCQTEKPSDCGVWWNWAKPGFVGTVKQVVAGGGGDRFSPEWDALILSDGNYYRPHWLTKDAPKVEKSNDFVRGYDFADKIFPSPFYDFNLFGKNSLGSSLYTDKPARTAMPAVSEHDELLTLRAQKHMHELWAAHWKGVADSREDQFKRATAAEIESAALCDVVEAQDEEIKALKTENRALKLCRDDWIGEAASSKKIARDSRLEEEKALEARDSALSLRNFALAISSAVVGSAGYVLYSCWGLI